MSPKRKTRESPTSISIGGDVKGIGIVVGNESQSYAAVSSEEQKPASAWNTTREIISNLLAGLFKRWFWKK